MSTNFGRADPPVMRQKSALNLKCESSVTCGFFSFFTQIKEIYIHVEARTLFIRQGDAFNRPYC